MPRQVDHQERRRDILQATVRVIGENGVKGLSSRAVAEELGGSRTMVTHYYRTQAELIAGLADSMLLNWDAEVAELERGHEDPYEKLALLLEWWVPTDEDGLLEERTRIALLAERLVGGPTSLTLDTWEQKARKILEEHIREIVPKKEVAPCVDMVRAFTNGLALSVVEHPEHWSRRRVLTTLRRGLEVMGLAKPG